MKVEGEKLVFYLAARGRKEQSRGWGWETDKGVVPFLVLSAGGLELERCSMRGRRAMKSETNNSMKPHKLFSEAQRTRRGLFKGCLCSLASVTVCDDMPSELN